jgi:hypothetical protein
MRNDKLVLGILLLATFLGTAWGQANVNENLETAFIYVDGTTGSDSNPGTQAEPFKTIGKAASVALANNQNSIGTRVNINPGVYRETFSMSSSASSTSLPITIQAAQNGTVIVSGSEVWTGWTQYGSNPNIYTNSWPYTWGLCPRAPGPIEQDINLRREMIFVNGVMLTQVLAQSELVQGTFYVDETHGVVYMFPPLGTDVSTATVEVSTQDSLFTGYQLTNFVMRGITFEESNSCRYDDAVRFDGGNNILIDTDGFNWNNAGGFGMDTTQYFTVQNTVANHNGERGFMSFEAKNGAWTADAANYNNWRGAQGGIYGWGGGGFYFYNQHDNTLSNINLLFNESHGIHWDTDNANVSGDSFIAAYNLRTGLIIEKSEGPMSITNSSVCFNSLLMGYTDGGLMTRTSTYVTLTGNNFADNYIGQIPVIGIQGGVPIPVTNYETGETYDLLNENMTLTSNTIVGLAGEQLFYDFDQSGTAWTDFQSTFISNNNLWWNGSVAEPFTVPVPAWFSTVDWAGWLSLTGQDSQSTFEAPTVDPTIACQVTPDAPDFWVINFETGSVTTTAGTPAVFTMILIPIGSFNGQTFFTSDGVQLIPGATKSWSQTSLKGSGRVNFTVNTSPKTPQGMYPVVVSARSGGVTRTVTMWLVVQ